MSTPDGSAAGRTLEDILREAGIQASGRGGRRRRADADEEVPEAPTTGPTAREVDETAPVPRVGRRRYAEADEAGVPPPEPVPEPEPGSEPGSGSGSEPGSEPGSGSEPGLGSGPVSVGPATDQLVTSRHPDRHDGYPSDQLLASNRIGGGVRSEPEHEPEPEPETEPEPVASATPPAAVAPPTAAPPVTPPAAVAPPAAAPPVTPPAAVTPPQPAAAAPAEAAAPAVAAPPRAPDPAPRARAGAARTALGWLVFLVELVVAAVLGVLIWYAFSLLWELYPYVAALAAPFVLTGIVIGGRVVRLRSGRRLGLSTLATLLLVGSLLVVLPAAAVLSGT